MTALGFHKYLVEKSRRGGEIRAVVFQLAWQQIDLLEKKLGDTESKLRAARCAMTSLKCLLAEKVEQIPEARLMLEDVWQQFPGEF